MIPILHKHLLPKPNSISQKDFFKNYSNGRMAVPSREVSTSQIKLPQIQPAVLTNF